LFAAAANRAGPRAPREESVFGNDRHQRRPLDRPRAPLRREWSRRGDPGRTHPPRNRRQARPRGPSAVGPAWRRGLRAVIYGARHTARFFAPCWRAHYADWTHHARAKDFPGRARRDALRVAAARMGTFPALTRYLGYHRCLLSAAVYEIRVVVMSYCEVVLLR